MKETRRTIELLRRGDVQTFRELQEAWLVVKKGRGDVTIKALRTARPNDRIKAVDTLGKYGPGQKIDAELTVVHPEVRSAERDNDGLVTASLPPRDGIVADESEFASSSSPIIMSIVLRVTAVTTVVLLLLVTACRDDPTAPITYPAAIAPSATTAWGTLGGVDIVGGYGSAVAVDPRDASIVYVMTDRGPNVATAVANQLFFPIPTFTPQIAKFRLAGGQLQKLSSIELKNTGGIRLSGIPNPSGQGGTGETAVGPNATPIALDPDGIDSEGLAIASDGSFWVSDEYGPHIVHFDATGRTIERINPFGAGVGGRRIPAGFPPS